MIILNKLKNNKILWGIFAVILVAVCVFWFFGDSIEHIEDTNGSDNYSLQQITDVNIINKDIGAIGGPNTEKDNITNTTTYFSNKFTGVAEIYGENITANRYEIVVNLATVESGNFRMVLLVDDEIVHDFTLNELTQSYVLENVSGYVSLCIAGESADFTFDYYII